MPIKYMKKKMNVQVVVKVHCKNTITHFISITLLNSFQKILNGSVEVSQESSH